MDNLEAIKIMQSIQAMLVSPQEEDKRVILAIQKGIDALQIRDVPDKKVGKWISVKDRLPESELDKFLVVNGRRVQLAIFMSGMWISVNDRKVSITHWMPLPEPPKEEEHETD